MTTPSNYAKNEAYSYAKGFGLSSALENLQTYRLAAGEISLRDIVESQAKAVAEASPKNEGAKEKRGGRKRKRQVLKDGIGGGEEAITSHAHYVMKRRMEKEHDRQHDVIKCGAKVASSIGFQPYNIENRALSKSLNCGKMGKVEVLCKDIASSVLGELVHRDTSDDEKELSEEDATNGRSDDLYNGIEPSCSQFPGKDALQGSDSEICLKRSEQRFAAPGEPCCVVCGRYGQYICDETDEDVCSLECKHELLHTLSVQHIKEAESCTSSFRSHEEPTGTSEVPDNLPHTWDFEKNHWTTRRSCLSTFCCWKCNRPGHLADDCTSVSTLSVLNDRQTPSIKYHSANSLSSELRPLYKRCKKVEETASAAKCSVCQRPTNLAFCFDCNSILCDSSGHLTGHLLKNPRHRQIYSYKLQRLIKCCNSTCGTTNMNELLACHFCFTKAFDKYYNMYTATWKGVGLKLLSNSICCEDHFTWHRMNCSSADTQDNALLLKKDGSDLQKGQLSEFLF